MSIYDPWVIVGVALCTIVLTLFVLDGIMILTKD